MSVVGQFVIFPSDRYSLSVNYSTVLNPPPQPQQQRVIVVFLSMTWRVHMTLLLSLGIYTAHMY